MRRNRRLYDCIAFARFCDDGKLTYGDAADLIALAARAFAAGVRECNIPDYDAGPFRKRFEVKAKSLRFAVQWPGLSPTIHRRGREVRIPLECAG